MPVKAKKTTRLKSLSIDDVRAQLKKKGSKASALTALTVKYSAASFGIYDFDADMKFYEYQLYGKDISAKKIVLNRLTKLEWEQGKLLAGKTLDEASVHYMKKFIYYSNSNHVKGLSKELRSKVKNQSKAYKEIMENNDKAKRKKSEK